ncbi:hypothetical protein C8E02_0535 [Vogesella indigofera]|uniref:Uncharacterized protein n=1 Tax=Vogesella indigofera TaxID=45465 RepID=A0A495BJM6_VOGIN|nr:hypothetical protein [Vogesella indigofera]RKQ60782.1 hypothetical protein C8E02_0535 [Vogesella indigofera]
MEHQNYVKYIIEEIANSIASLDHHPTHLAFFFLSNIPGSKCSKIQISSEKIIDSIKEDIQTIQFNNWQPLIYIIQERTRNSFFNPYQFQSKRQTSFIETCLEIILEKNKINFRITNPKITPNKYQGISRIESALVQFDITLPHQRKGAMYNDLYSQWEKSTASDKEIFDWINTNKNRQKKKLKSIWLWFINNHYNIATQCDEPKEIEDAYILFDKLLLIDKKFDENFKKIVKFHYNNNQKEKEQNENKKSPIHAKKQLNIKIESYLHENAKAIAGKLGISLAAMMETLIKKEMQIHNDISGNFQTNATHPLWHNKNENQNKSQTKN